jgi:hypothetical protein
MHTSTGASPNGIVMHDAPGSQGVGEVMSQNVAQ